jgi:hypothetical protein
MDEKDLGEARSPNIVSATSESCDPKSHWESAVALKSGTFFSSPPNLLDEQSHWV